MELLREYIAGLQSAIYAGSNMRMMLEERSVGVLSLTIDEEQKKIKVGYLIPETPFEQFTFVSAKTVFSVAFDDLPNLLRHDGWDS